jgi:hypothetical protein
MHPQFYGQAVSVNLLTVRKYTDVRKFSPFLDLLKSEPN